MRAICYLLLTLATGLLGAYSTTEAAETSVSVSGSSISSNGNYTTIIAVALTGAFTLRLEEIGVGVPYGGLGTAVSFPAKELPLEHLLGVGFWGANYGLRYHPEHSIGHFSLYTGYMWGYHRNKAGQTESKPTFFVAPGWGITHELDLLNIDLGLTLPYFPTTAKHPDFPNLQNPSIVPYLGLSASF